MLLNRTFSHVAVVLLILLMGASALGQGLEGMQLFAPADVSSYGRGTQPNEGFFFTYDILYWTISTPRVTDVGSEKVPEREAYIYNQGVPIEESEIRQHNTLDTGGLQSYFDLGNRFEFGRICDNHGWMVSIYQLRERSQSVPAYDVDMIFAEVTSETNVPYKPLDGRFTSGGTTVLLGLPVNFSNVLLRNDTSSWGIEFDYLCRSNQLHNGGFFEWFIGPRYIEFDDTFLVNAQGSETLENSYWINEAQNHIIAGQIGARLFKKQGRWTISTEGRALAGLNCQNVKQTGELGGLPGDANQIVPGVVNSNQPFYMGPSLINHTAFIHEFTPGIELRLDARYQITRSVNFHAGWSGLWLNNIARGSETIDYTLGPDQTYMGILRDHNRDNVFINGLTIGIDINR